MTKDEQLEMRMSRSLDGLCGDEEELSLKRELIRNPDAHQQFEDYRRIDFLAREAMGGLNMDGEVDFDPLKLTAISIARPRNRFQGYGLLVAGAIAAALLAIVIPSPLMNAKPARDAGSQTATLFPGATVINQQSGRLENPVMRTVGASPSIHRETGREVIGVVGDDGNLYWIEVERTRTIRLPRGLSLEDDGRERM